MATATHRISTASTLNVTSYASGAFTPAVGDLLVAFVTATGTVAADAKLTGTGAGQFFTQVTSAVKAASVDTTYMFIGTALVTAAASQTVTFDCTSDAATGAIIQVFSLSGMTRTGNSAVRQFKTVDNSATGTPAPAFTSAVLTGNPTAGVISNAVNPATITPPTSWTEQNDTGYATPTTGAEYVTRDSGFTGTTVTWGGSAGSAYCAIIAEFDTSANPAKAATLVDTFTGSSFGAQWTATGTVDATVSGGTAHFHADSYGSDHQVWSAVPYDLTSSEVVWDVSALPSTTSVDGPFFTLELYDGTLPGPTYHYLRWFYYAGSPGAGTWEPEYKNTGTAQSSTALSSGSGTRWLRIKHDGTNVLWDTSPDGSTWTNQWSVAKATVGLPFGGLRVAMRAGSGGATTGDFEVNNVNTLGTTAVARFAGVRNYHQSAVQRAASY